MVFYGIPHFGELCEELASLQKVFLIENFLGVVFMISIPDGVWPILLTPFTASKQLDLEGLDALVSFYKKLGVSGILALGQASEVLTLSDEERFVIAERVAKQCQAELPLVIVGNFGQTLDQQAKSLKKMVAFGADVAVVGLSLLPSKENLDTQLLELAAKTGNIPLGIYELPEPEHRLLTSEQVARVAASGHYVFMKDTCRQLEPFTAKAKAAVGTPLKLFQANLKVLPETMKVGSAGFCGWMPMVAPELCAQLIDHKTPEAIKQKAYEKLMAFQTAMVDQGFPASAKHLLLRRGVDIASYSRVDTAMSFSSKGATTLDHYLETNDPFSIIPEA